MGILDPTGIPFLQVTSFEDAQANFEFFSSYVPTVTYQAGDLRQTAAPVDASNWLWCNGAAISRAKYSTLFTAISTGYGVGDGSTTFNLPTVATVGATFTYIKT